MKKQLWRCLSSVLSLCLLLSMCILPAGALSQNEVDAPQYTIHEAYEYPILPGTDEWKSFTSLDEKISAVQIPTNIMESMDTQALFETILNYPMLGDLYIFGDISQGFAALKSRCNGIPELLSRPDALDVIYEAYQTFPIVQTFEGGNEDGYNAVFRQPFLEALLYAATSSVQEAPISSSQIAEIESTVMEKQAEKDASGQYSGVNHIYAQLKVLDTITPYASASIKTPKGTRVTVQILGETLSNAEKQEMNAYMSSNFPNAVRIAEPTTNYNCHSYAWYSTNTSTNKYWINSNEAYKYVTDGSYSKRSGGTASQTNDRVFYPNADIDPDTGTFSTHSGIEIGMYPITVNSKWGPYGLYNHSLTDCPYSSHLVEFWYR